MMVRMSKTEKGREELKRKRNIALCASVTVVANPLDNEDRDNSYTIAPVLDTNARFGKVTQYLTWNFLRFTDSEACFQTILLHA